MVTKIKQRSFGLEIRKIFQKIQKNAPNSEKYSWKIHFLKAKSPFFQLWCRIIECGGGVGLIKEVGLEFGSEFERHTLLAVDHVEGLEEGCEKH